MKRKTIVTMLAFCTLNLIACGDPKMTYELSVDDDYEIAWALHTPYLAGSEVTIYVRWNVEGSLNGWSVTSHDSDVFSVLSQKSNPDGTELSASCRAVDVGATELRVIDDQGKIRATRSITVVEADGIMLYSSKQLAFYREQAAPLDLSSPVKVLAGGTYSLGVAYIVDGERLEAKRAVVAAASDPSVTLTIDQDIDADFVRITCDLPGSYEVELSVNGTRMALVSIDSVEATAIASTRVDGRSTEGIEEGITLLLAARSFDENEKEIFGVEYAWSIDSVPEEYREGDLFLYSYSPQDSKTVTASHGSSSSTLSVQMNNGMSFSSNDNIVCSFVGCSF